MIISSSSQGPLKTVAFKALLKLLSSKVMLNSAVRLAGLGAFLYFSNWMLLLLTSGAVMSVPLSAVSFSFDLVPQHKAMSRPFSLLLKNSEKIVATYWLSRIYPDEVGNAHRNGDYHIHDLGMFTPYCAGWSLRQMLEE